MNTVSQNALALTHWIINQHRKCLLDSPMKILQYVNDALNHGKISVYFEPEERVFKAVVFHWLDQIELIEHKAEQGQQQYTFGQMGKGNAMFVAEAIGIREHIALLYKAMFRKCSTFSNIPLYTFRRGKLHSLKHETMFRFSHRWEGAF